MQLTFADRPLPDLEAEALIIGVPESPFGWGPGEAGAGGPRPMVTGSGLAAALAAVQADGGFKGEAEEVEVLFPVPGLRARRVALVGLGKETLTAEAWRRAVGEAMAELRGKARSVAILPPTGLDPAVAMGAAAEAAVMAAYDGRLYRTKKEDDERPFETLVLACPPEGPAAEAASRGAALARIVNRARDLSNMPGNKLPVPELRDAVLAMAKAHGMKTRVFEMDELKREGFGCLVGVGQGSDYPPCFVVVEYQGHEMPNEPPYVLVGKGITFDTGGISLKPRAGMEEMKTDMHGVATVMGVLAAAAERKLPLNLVALCPMAENMPSGRAVKPGDLLKAYNGLMVECVDTDAEGRLILADALAYGAKHYQAQATVDVATLTGSIIMALGYEASGLFTPDDALATQLSACGEATGERVWRFPVWEEYEHHVASDIADLRNIYKGKGDAISAAMFLKRFAGEGPWVHLDIAGPSYLSEAKNYKPKGSTGVGIRMLVEWLERRAAVG